MVVIKQPIKKCIDCHKYLTIRSFYKDNRSPDKKTKICKSCAFIRRKEWFNNNRPKCREYVKNYNIKIRDKLYNLLGNKCACCGENIKEFLQIDHVNNDGAKDRLEVLGNSRGGHQLKMYKHMIENIHSGKYQLLCANCNFGKMRNNGVCPHNK